MQKAAFAAMILLLVGCINRKEETLRRSLHRTSGVVRLPAGVVEISSELDLTPGSKDLEIQGHPSGTVIRAAGNFRGRALIVARSASHIRFRNFTIDGNKTQFQKTAGLPPSDTPFAQFTPDNGILVERVGDVTISGVRLRNIAGFAILISSCANVAIENAEVEDSGSKNQTGRNNTTGGILLEEGVIGFRVVDCRLSRIRGNGVWTHSLYRSPRNGYGLIARNVFDTIGRDPIQIGHAYNVLVENNTGTRIGFPHEVVDVEGGGIPAALDTAGNVERCTYSGNRFEEVNGKCIDLDGFHEGKILNNTCINKGSAEDYPHGHYGIVFNNSNPDMTSERVVVSGNTIDGAKFGGIFVIGSRHSIVGNHLRNLNKARCNESGNRFGCLSFPKDPRLLETGIYLGRGAERPAVARHNVITDNEISGYKMKTRCIAAAPGVSLANNLVRNNRCADSVDGP
jgi:hypothetical protein